DLAADVGYIRRFEAEAKAVAPISHPNIISVYSIGQYNGSRYIVFEYVQGVTLREYLSRKGPFDAVGFLAVARKIASALQRAHEEGLVHRDIKPENILMTKKGEVKVADFGLAKQITRDEVHLTQSGVTVGTPLYMSPEQIEGKDLDQRSDLYSLGITSFHMLAGRPPFQGETAMAVALLHLRGEAPKLSEFRPELPPELVRVVAKLMQRDRDKRYGSAKELLKDLTQLRAGVARGESTEHIAAQKTADPSSTATGEQVEQRPSGLALHMAAVAMTPGRHLFVVVLLGVVAALGGASLGWTEREPDYLRGRAGGKGPPLAPPDVSRLQRQTDGFMQLIAARNGRVEDREAGLWAVLEWHKSDEDAVVRAAVELLRMYLKQPAAPRASLLAETLIQRDDKDPQAVGHLAAGLL
ncbi:MAG: protein kinase domain-containing protein, partial [Planctomycetia bacterium]